MSCCGWLCFFLLPKYHWVYSSNLRVMNNNPKIRFSSKSKLRLIWTKKKKKKLLLTIYHQINAKKKIVLEIKIKGWKQHITIGIHIWYTKLEPTLSL